MNIAEFLYPSAWFQPDAGPRYVQLRNRIAAGVDQGILVPGSPLPAEREIASITDFSRVTVRKAIRSLADEGTIIQKQGSGSFISPQPARIEQRLSRLTSFSEDMEKRGRSVSSRWLERGLFMPNALEMEALGLNREDTVARIARLRMADGEPMAIERASLPADILPNPLIVELSLYEVLERTGHRPVRAQQKISAINIEESEAEILAVKPGDAVLRIERTSFLENGDVAEFTQSLYRGDAYDFVADLSLTKE